MIRYKLVRIVGGHLLSANQDFNTPVEGHCLEYKIGEVTSATDRGVACYKRKGDALKPGHIRETRDHFNQGKPIALLKLEPIGRTVYTDPRYRKGGAYEGGRNYRSVKVLEILLLG